METQNTIPRLGCYTCGQTDPRHHRFCPDSIHNRRNMTSFTDQQIERLIPVGMANHQLATATQRKTGAAFAYCNDCGLTIEPNQYWTLTQRVWLHESNTVLSHTLIYWHYAA